MEVAAGMRGREDSESHSKAAPSSHGSQSHSRWADGRTQARSWLASDRQVRVCAWLLPNNPEFLGEMSQREGQRGRGAGEDRRLKAGSLDEAVRACDCFSLSRREQDREGAGRVGGPANLILYDLGTWAESAQR